MKTKRWIAAFLCFLLIGSMLPVNAFAANDIIGNKYTLTLDENWEGGTSQVIPNITSYELPSVTRSGETFYGWASAPAGEVRYRAGDTVTLSHDLTLYAVWDAEGFTESVYYVIFDANGGTGTMERGIWYSSSGGGLITPFSIPDCGFTREGYTFKGWATSPDGPVEYLPGDTYDTFEDLFLFAVWEQNDYHTVTVNNDGNGTATADKASYEKGETVTLTATPNAGYHFKEWQSDDVTIADNSFTMPEKDVTVTAIFEADAPTTYTGTGWYLDADGVLHITGEITESGFGLTNEQRLQVKSVVAESGASISSGEFLFNGFENMTSADLILLNTTGVTNMGYMFSRCSSLTSLNLSRFDTSSVKDMSYMFFGCSSLAFPNLNSFDTSSVTTMDGMFSGCRSLFYLDVSGFRTSNVTSMIGMFTNCSSLTSLNLNSFDTSSVDNMGGMFLGCSSLTFIDLSSFDTSSVTTMEGMFRNCSGLTSLDLSSFDTRSVDNMGGMFLGCSSLTSLDVSGFRTYSLTYADEMFRGCSALTSLGIRPDILSENADDIIAIRSSWQKQGSTDTYSTADELKAVTDTVTLLAMYTVNVQNDGNGTASANPAAAVKGDTITLTATPNNGYHFKEWQSDDVTIADNSFTMPEKDVTVKAIFEADAPTTYNIWVSGTQITSANKDNVLGNSKVSYDPDINILTVSYGANITGTHEDALIYAENMDLTVYGDVTLTAAAKIGIYVKGGSLTVNGDVTLTAAAEKGIYVREGSLTVNGSYTAEAAYPGNIAAWATGSITVTGDVTVKNYGYGLEADSGKITVGGHVTAEAFAVALCTEVGDISVGEAVDITLVGDCNGDTFGIRANGAVEITGGAAITGNNGRVAVNAKAIELGGDAEISGFAIGLYASDGDIAVKGDADITINSENENAITAQNGNVTIGGNATVGGKGDCAIYANEDLAVGKDVTVTGNFNHGLRASNGKVTMESGKWDITASCDAIEAKTSIVIPTTHKITLPDGGKIGQDASNPGYAAVSESDGTTVAKQAVIEPVFTVSFDMNGHGDQLTELTVKEGEMATKPVDPTASGWTFGGWYADATFSARFDFNTAIKADTTIYAKWTENTTPPAPTYTMIAGADGEWTKGSTTGLSFTSDAPFAKFDSVQVDESTIAAANYTAEEGSTKITLAPAYLETLSIGSHSIKIVSKDGSASTNFTVKAAAQPPVPAKYTVSFNMNGHGTQITAQTVESGFKAAKPADPKASGYTFGGWYADATFSARFDFDTAITANTTAYAKWTKNSAAPADPASPQTGDTSDMFLWIALLLVSGGALVGTTVYSRKKKYNAK